MQPTAPEAQMVWNNYELHVKLYKGYLELVLKFNLFFYAVTAAELSYCLSKPELPMMRYGILVPCRYDPRVRRILPLCCPVGRGVRWEVLRLGKVLDFRSCRSTVC
jgi:hypothetical protein